MLADNALGWDIVLKILHLPSKLHFSTKYIHFSDIRLQATGIVSWHASRLKRFIY